MESISFFTPVVSLNVCEKYFDLGCQKAVPTGKTTADGKIVVELVDRPGFDSLGECCLSWITTALKVLSYATVVIPLIMLAVKAILRSQHTFVYEPESAKQAKRSEIREVFDKEVGDWITVVHEMDRAKTQLLEQNVPEFKGRFLNSKNAEESIFELSRYPGYRFWFIQDAKAGERYLQNLLEAERIRENSNYKHLVVPPAKLYALNSGAVMIVQKLEGIELASVQKEAYLDSGTALDDAVRELTDFSCKAHLGSPMDPIDYHRDIPIDTQSRFVLLHLRSLQGDADYAINGLNQAPGGMGMISAIVQLMIGGGLLRQVSEHHIPIVEAAATRYGVKLNERLVKERNQEVAAYRALQQFYQKNHITNGNESLPQFFKEALDLDLNQNMLTEEDIELWQQRGESVSLTLGQALDALILTMNTALEQERTKDISIMNHRLILIKDSDHRSSSRDPIGYARDHGSGEWGFEKKFLGQLLTKLKEQGVIFDFEAIGTGILIQA